MKTDSVWLGTFNTTLQEFIEPSHVRDVNLARLRLQAALLCYDTISFTPDQWQDHLGLILLLEHDYEPNQNGHPLKLLANDAIKYIAPNKPRKQIEESFLNAPEIAFCIAGEDISPEKHQKRAKESTLDFQMRLVAESVYDKHGVTIDLRKHIDLVEALLEDCFEQQSSIKTPSLVDLFNAEIPPLRDTCITYADSLHKDDHVRKSIIDLISAFEGASSRTARPGWGYYRAPYKLLKNEVDRAEASPELRNVIAKIEDVMNKVNGIRRANQCGASTIADGTGPRLQHWVVSDMNTNGQLVESCSTILNLIASLLNMHQNYAIHDYPTPLSWRAIQELRADNLWRRTLADLQDLYRQGEHNKNVIAEANTELLIAMQKTARTTGWQPTFRLLGDLLVLMKSARLEFLNSDALNYIKSELDQQFDLELKKQMTVAQHVFLTAAASTVDLRGKGTL